MQRNHVYSLGIGLVALLVVALLSGCGGGNAQTEGPDGTGQGLNGVATAQADGFGVEGAANAAPSPQDGSQGQPVGRVAVRSANGQPRDASRTLRQTSASNAQQTPPVFSGATPEGADRGVRYARWADPTQNAFSVDVPQGWRVSGGTRLAGHAVEAVSPDGTTLVQSGDLNKLGYMEPDMWSGMWSEVMGMVNGNNGGNRDCYPTNGICLPYAKFQRGADYAAAYVREKFAHVCADFAIQSGRARPDWEGATAQSLQADLWRQTGLRIEISAGEVAFSCRLGGQPMQGRYLAVNTLSGGGFTGAVWGPYVLLGYLAPEEQAGTAQAIVERMVQSFRHNPQWLQQQQMANQQMIQSQRDHFAARQNAIRDANAYTNNLIVGGHEARSNVYDNVFRNDANARRGATDVANPDTGQTWNVGTGGNYSNYYWVDPTTGYVYGTDTYNPPAPGYVPLQEY